MGIKEFSKSTLKISIAICIGGLGIVGVIWVVHVIREDAQKREAVQYETMKEWPSDVKKHLQMDVSARTKLVDGRLMVAVTAEGFPEYLSHPSLGLKNYDGALILSFLDRDGFKIYEKKLTISEFTTTVDAQGKKIGLSHQFTDHMVVSQYSAFSRLRVGWNLDTEIPKPAPKPSPSVTMSRTSDHCAPDLSRAERIKRLGQHGAVRETGRNSYAAGVGHQLAYFSDGNLMYCR